MSVFSLHGCDFAGHLAGFGAPGGNPLLGRTHGFVGAMYAANPAARAALAVVHFVAHDHDVLGAGFGLGNCGRPANPFVACQVGDVFPGSEHFLIGKDGLAHIAWQLMHRAIC